MRPASSARVTQLLVNWRQGDSHAREALIPLVYNELRRIAGQYLGRERPDHTLQRAAPVHQAYLHLMRKESPQWRNRAHFIGIAAQIMRHILADRARARRAAKRDGGQQLSLDPQLALLQKREVDLVALDDALGKLATVKREWAAAKTWLNSELRPTSTRK